MGLVLGDSRLMRRRMLGVLMALVLTFITVAGAVPAGAEAVHICDRTDINTLIQAAPRTTQTAEFDEAWANCQFRLYDDNDGETNPDQPEIPHVFSERDYILGGILLWWTRDELTSMGWTKQQGIEDMEKVGDRVLWGAKGAKPARIPLSSTDYRVVRDPEYGWLVITHRYLVFKPGSLSPGTYEWRWEQSYQGEVVGVTMGTVIITRG